MLLSAKALDGYKIRATDGELGGVHELYFDDREFTIRYFVVDTAALFGRRVLLSPQAVTQADHANKVLVMNLTQEQIKNSPDVTTEATVDQLHQVTINNYYGWANPMYPARVGMLYPYGVGYVATGLPPTGALGFGRTENAQQSETGEPPEVREMVEKQQVASALRSDRTVSGYHILALDGEIGHVDDFLIDDGNWYIRYLVVETGNWLSHHKVLLAPEWVESFSWDEGVVRVQMPRAMVQSSPVYEPGEVISREYEQRLYDNYKQPKYWEDQNRGTADDRASRH